MTVPTMPEDNSIFADNHSLFWTINEPEFTPVTDAEGFYEEQPGYTVYKLFIGDFNETSNGLQRIINKLQQVEPNDVLEFHISSHGGAVEELIELYNLCNTVFYGRMSTFVNFGYSAGAWAFLFGTERVVFEHSDLMFHSYSGGFGGKRDDMLTHMEHEDKRINKFLMGTLEPYFTKKEIKKMIKGKDFWLGSIEMLQRGIATHILIDGEAMTADEYLNPKKPEKTTEPKKVKRKKK